MRHNKLSQDQTKMPAGVKLPSATAQLNKSEIPFAPSPDEVARKAYFSYMNEGSRPGHEVQHWLSAEADLIAESKMTREHAFHNQT
jgi:Protein of unknown function (DUF2934)